MDDYMEAHRNSVLTQWLQNTTTEYFNAYHWSLPNNVEPDRKAAHPKPTTSAEIAKMEERIAAKSKVKFFLLV